jgi:hypothetical protein
MRARCIEFLLIGWVSVAPAQTGSDAPISQLPLELSDQQLQCFVSNVRDFLYRSGGHFDDFNYSLLEDLTSNTSAWHEQASATPKYEVVALCQRSASYDSLGLAEELNLIGEKFDSQYSDNIRRELSQLSDNAAQRVREYVWSSDIRGPLRPWSVILGMVQEGSVENLDKFVCEVANERL